MSSPLSGLAWTALVATVAACTPAGGGAGGAGSTDPLASIEAALQGQPDEATLASLHVLADALSLQEIQYLSQMTWVDDDGTTLLSDPALRKGLAAVDADASRSTSTARGARAPHPAAPGAVRAPAASGSPAPAASPSEQAWLYRNARGLLLKYNGVPRVRRPGVVAATINAIRDVVLRSDGGTPAAAAEVTDMGTWICSTTYPGDGGAPDEECDYQCFCSNGEITYPGGNMFCPGSCGNGLCEDCVSEVDTCPEDCRTQPATPGQQCSEWSDGGANYGDYCKGLPPILVRCFPKNPIPSGCEKSSVYDSLAILCCERRPG